MREELSPVDARFDESILAIALGESNYIEFCDNYYEKTVRDIKEGYLAPERIKPIRELLEHRIELQKAGIRLMRELLVELES